MGVRLARCVTGRGVTLIRKVFEGAPAGCINLGLGQPVDPLPAVAREAIVAALDEGVVPYSPTAGLAAAREAVGERVYGDSAESVLLTSGSQEALWLALMGTVDPGDEVIFAEPGYPAYRAVTELIGARPVPVQASYDERFRLPVEEVERALTPRTRAVIVASPANPTGMHAGDDASLARLHATCAARDVWLIADEIYAAIAFRHSHAPLAGLGPRVIAIGGLSKAFSATGLRIGWIHALPEVIQGLVPLHQQVALAAPTLGQRATVACLATWGPDLFREVAATYAPRRKAALDALSAIPGLRYHAPDGAFYVFVDVSAHAQDTLALALRLRDEQGVITVPGEGFGPAGSGWLRLSFVGSPETITEGIGRVGRFLAS